ncbi:lytic transglycosylase domain-containing protein [Actinoplanes sp. NPDC023936]|uniref:aggregation-promoting factor C-terminal-like domain-containing protein n=1 Tax=Actinoplanes sp. NPDC023936 TaxID=3154910 RepID=UPI0033D18B85
MKRLWSRLGVRAASVGLLVTGLVGGVYLGQNRELEQQSATSQLVLQADADEMQLLKQRQAQHAAARAVRSQAEDAAASKAATEAKTAATKARTLEKKAIAAEAAEKKAAEEKKKAEAAEAGGPVAYTGDIPESCNEYSGSRKIGCAMTLDAGFGLSQFPCLDKLWKKESGWNYKATNRSSGAYGIPQSLPGSKMASAGSDWKTNPATQIEWGLGYIKGRYGTPCSAWSHSQNVGWY